MTGLLGDLHFASRLCGNPDTHWARKNQKVTGSQDDDLVGGLQYGWLYMPENTQVSKRDLGHTSIVPDTVYLPR